MDMRSACSGDALTVITRAQIPSYTQLESIRYTLVNAASARAKKTQASVLFAPERAI